jgi:hypothetical protein
MGRSGSGHGHGYWPGYVDALVNVVLNLIFLAAILAVGGFTLGLESSRRRLLESKAQEQTSRVTAERTSPTEVPKPKPKPTVQTGSNVRGAQLGLRFAGNTVRLDERSHELLKRELRRQFEQGVLYWQVTIETDVNDNLQRRAAYLRMMAVRSVFLEVGIDPVRFDLRMQAAKAAGVGAQMVRIVPGGQAPVRKLTTALRETGSGTMSLQPAVKENN